MKKNTRKESGAVEVEATIILPIAILSVLLLLYLSLFLFQRANLQASLQTALVYYKNTVTDSYVTRNDELQYALSEGTYMGSGNSYSVSGPLNPYSKMFHSQKNIENQESFEKYFDSIAGNMLFDDNLELSIDYKNFILLKQFTVTATQEVEAPIDFSVLGIDNKFTISTTSKVNITDHDDMIRNIDYVVYLVKDTKLGEWCTSFAGKFKEAYGKMKSFLNVEG